MACSRRPRSNIVNLSCECCNGQPNRVSYELRLKFGKQAYCVIELQLGEDAFDVANKLWELAA
jgi:hypothetical protein